MLPPSPQRCRMRPEGGGGSSWDCLPPHSPCPGTWSLFLKHPQIHLVVGTTGVIRHTDSQLQPHRLVCWVWGGAWASSGSHRLAVLGDADQFHLPVDSGPLVLVVGTATCPREGRARFGGPGLPGRSPHQERGVPQERCDQRFPRAGGGLAPTQVVRSRPASGRRT